MQELQLDEPSDPKQKFRLIRSQVPFGCDDKLIRVSLEVAAALRMRTSRHSSINPKYISGGNSYPTSGEHPMLQSHATATGAVESNTADIGVADMCNYPTKSL